MAHNSLKCTECHMVFKSPSLLNKHRQKFCVGGELGDPHDLQLRKGLRTEEKYTYDDKPIVSDIKPLSPYVDKKKDDQIWHMAKTHGKNMANLTAQSLDLERQKNDIRRRLMELNEEPSPTSQLLKDLKEQESKTQQTLEQLKDQLNSIEKKGRKMKPPVPVVYNIGNNLTGEIRVLRQNYLQQGGSDPVILAQLADMMTEAQTLEDKKKNDTKPPPKAKPAALFPETQAMELENARLQRELLLLQEKNASDRHRYSYDHDHYTGGLEKQVFKMEQEHSRKMAELQLEIEKLRQQSELEKYKRELAEDIARNTEPKVSPVQVISHERVQAPYAPPNPPGPIPYEMNPLGPAVYDPHRGFVIYYDFIQGLVPGPLAARLVVGLYDSRARVGDPAILPPVDIEVPEGYRANHYSVSGAVVGAKQHVPRCQAQSDLGIVVELQLTSSSASAVEPNKLVSRAWTKISVFNDYNQLNTGRFYTHFKTLPISPLMQFRDMESLPKFGEARIFYRIVHARDGPRESRAPVGFQNAFSYRPPPVNFHNISKGATPPPPPSATPPSSPALDQVTYRQSDSPEDGSGNSERTIGFQVDRVKGAESGQAKVRLTAYHAYSGKVVYSSTSPVTCGTTTVRSNFKYGYHVFGQQEATFEDVELKGDIIVIARFYLIHQDGYDVDSDDMQLNNDISADETLVAWAAMPLIAIKKAGSYTERSRHPFNPRHMKINTGSHTLRLYRPPVPSPSQVPVNPNHQPPNWVRYREASIRFHIFSGAPRPGSLTPSEASDDEDTLPESAWLPLERRASPSEPFTSDDGFDIYIDGCRFLPDSVTFSRVSARILDRRYMMYGQDMMTGVKLDSDIYNPVYEHKEEIRDPEIPATATLVMKLYTVDNFYKQLTCVGYSLLNIFVQSGTERQPIVDSGIQVSLNEGAHQLRVYNQGPDEDEPISESCLRDRHVRYIPCASVLVRLVKVVRGKNGRPLESSRVPEDDWVRLGLWQPRPWYSDHIYYSEKCRPTRGETQLFQGMVKRAVIPVREVAARLAAQNKESRGNYDRNLEQYVRNQLTRATGSQPLAQDLNLITAYSPIHGLKVAVDGASNIPWSNFSLASICLNPPGAFYMEAHLATYDKLMFVQELDLNSSTAAPVWKDGFKHFPHRSYHKYLTVIIHIQEVGVTQDKQNFKYGLLDQAWTVVQVFTDKYPYSMVFQLPLLKGAPKPEQLKQLAKEPCREWLKRNLTNNTIRLLEGASVFVRLCDARRDEELPENVPERGKVEINYDYIPPQLESQYSQRKDGKTLESLVPASKSPLDFSKTLAVKFKSLIYKLYEEGNVSG